MPANISGIGSASGAGSVSNTENTRQTETLKGANASERLSSTSEDGYVEASPTLDENSSSEDFEQEMLRIQEQMNAIEMEMERNTTIKELYEKEYNSVKQQIESAQARLQTAQTQEAQRMYQNKIFTLGQSLDSISMKINSQGTVIQSKASDVSTLGTLYQQTFAKYQQAYMNEQMAVIQSLQGAQGAYSSSPVSGVSGDFTGLTPTNSSGASSGKVSSRMLSSLKGWEGLRTTAYRCPAGVWTIGYGHTSGVSAGQQITEAQAEQYLRQDLASFENEVSSYASSIGLELTQGQYDSLVSFAYNLGGGCLKKSGIMEMLKSGNIDGAASKMKQYCHANGKVLQGLVSRRNTEASWLYT